MRVLFPAMDNLSQVFNTILAAMVFVPACGAFVWLGVQLLVRREWEDGVNWLLAGLVFALFGIVTVATSVHPDWCIQNCD